MTKNPHILICDDDSVVHESLGLYLDNAGFTHVSAFDGKEALEKRESENPDLIILDLMMPGMDGTDVCREIRKTSRVPIIMLTARGEEIDRILGLELGADDYIVKPFSPREVVARIKAVLRRFEDVPAQEGESEDTVVLPMLEVSLKNYRVKVMGQVMQFTPKEVEILYLLTSKAGEVLTREQILSSVWGYDYFGDTRTVDAHIKRIRQKLPQENVPWALKTVYGVGYRFEVSAG